MLQYKYWFLAVGLKQGGRSYYVYYVLIVEVDLLLTRFLMNSFLPMAQDCSQVPVDGKRSLQRGESYGVYDGHLTELNPPVSSEIKNGQWLGVEVKSQGEGGKVIGK